MSSNSNLAISNIAWQPQEDNEVFSLMHSYNFAGLEVAPTKIFSDPITTQTETIKKYRNRCEKNGIQIVAMQSLLFGKPELQLFQTEEKRTAMKTYLKAIMKFGSLLGVQVVVFGSPKNRIIPADMSQEEALRIATDFFRDMGEAAKKMGMFFCIEPNPQFYGTNFINTSKEAIDLVKQVDHPHFRFHLDTGALFLTGEAIKVIIKEGSPYLHHCHISEKGLAVLTENLDRQRKSQYKQIADALQKANYSGWISIEMRANQDTSVSNVENIQKSLAFVKSIYGR